MKLLIVLCVIIIPTVAKAAYTLDCGKWDENHHPNEFTVDTVLDMSAADGNLSFSINSRTVSTKEYFAWNIKNNKGKIISLNIARVSHGNVTEYVFESFSETNGRLRIYEYQMGKARPVKAKRSLGCLGSLPD